MWKRLRELLARYRQRRELMDSVDPKAFGDLSRELRDLARIASTLWPDEPAFQTRVKRIQDEMDQLDAMASRPEFMGIAPEKRMELRRSLICSRDQLMDTVRRAEPPTSTTQ